MDQLRFYQINLLNNEETESVFFILKQLRPHLTRETYSAHLMQLSKESYELWAATRQSAPVGLVGFRRYTDFVRGTHLYIDDLVVDSTLRSEGVGAQLLVFAQDYCKKESLPSMRLCCALENERGFEFYKREAWTPRSYALVKKV